MKRVNAWRAGIGSLGAAAAAILLLGACSDPRSAAGFRLPDGDPDAGRIAFTRLNCHQCHTVAGEQFPATPPPARIIVPLGGEVVRVQTYGQLVTSIINPQHIVSPKYRDKYTDGSGASLMPHYNKSMTVGEMIDLVTFLQTHYTLKPPEYSYPPSF
jgi:L-cysteine S-thiosulfotransferase